MKSRRNQTSAARQALHKKAEQNKKNKLESSKKINAESMVFAGVLSSSTMNRVSMVLDACGVDHESLTKATAMLPDVERKMEEKANESCSKARSEMSSWAATDTRWSGQKNGSEATTSWIDLITGKILAYSNSIKVGRGKMNANFTGASNMMESQGLRSCLTIMEGDDSLGSIKVFARDMDNKSWPILQEYGFDPETERFDPGHYRKNFDKRWKNFTDENKNYEYIENGEKHIIKQPFPGLLTFKALAEHYTGHRR